MFAALNSFLTRAVSGYFLNKSLRFRSSASAYLNRTPATTTNRTTWTWSGWIKRGALTSGTCVFGTQSAVGGVPRASMGFTSDAFDMQFNPTGAAWSVAVTTSQVFRDPAAWYHFVIAIDTTQGTASDRLKFYVNGSQVTAFSTATYPTASLNLPINLNQAHQICADGIGASAFDGELAEINFVDGQALAPTSFGTFNSYNQWLPIKYAGTYGTNGFYLPFNSVSTSSYAGSFNGSSQYLNVNSVTAVGTGDFTVETFVYFNSLGDEALFQLDTAGLITNWSLSLDATANKFRFFVRNDAATTNADILSSAAAVTNQWYHVAGVVSGTTATLYVNGISVASATLSGVRTGTGTTIFMGQNGASGGRFLNGYMSNNRYVKGTAVYTANFTPSVVPLTAITNTQLLTLQNATIVDNSTNAFTITNTGTVVTSVQSPFLNTTVLTADSSGNANNWTPNNISLTAGSTYDSLTDVPTLTSETVANYATWNPIAQSTVVNGTVTRSNGNLTSTDGGTTYGLASIGTIAVTTGKFYGEVTLTSAGGTYANIGVVDLNSPLSAGTHTGICYSQGTGNKSSGSNVFAGSGITAYGLTYTTGDIIGIALDLTGGSITFYKNNASQGVAYTGISGNYTPAVGDGQNATSYTFDLNCGQQPFTYTAPTGFLPLNTYNI